ncbi:MAG: 30S ribosome-binding factor RbfA [Anaerolineales bacterium]
MTSQGRANRVAQRVKEELATMLLFDLSDPRLEGVFITDVKVDREMAYANIFVSALEGAERSEEILQGFQSASGYIRRRLAQSIDLRSFPHLRFNWDPTPENADRIDKLLATLHDDETDTDEQ